MCIVLIKYINLKKKSVYQILKTDCIAANEHTSFNVKCVN